MICDRMARSLDDLRERSRSKRFPKAFYLSEDDFAEFMATKPPTGDFEWGNNPPKMRTDAVFKGLPVRESEAKVSRLYDHTNAGRKIADEA